MQAPEILYNVFMSHPVENGSAHEAHLFNPNTLPTFSGRLHLPTTPVADALRFLDDPTRSWAPRPPAPGEKDLRELSEAE